MNSSRKNPRIVVAGLGNELLQDDGAGVHASRMLAAAPLPGATVVEVGTAVWDLVELLDGVDALIAIDAVQAGRAPGSVMLLQGEDAHTALCGSGAHGIGLMEMLSLSGSSPATVVVVGIEPEDICYGIRLSETVTQALPRVVEAVRLTVAAWQARPDTSRTMNFLNIEQYRQETQWGYQT